MKKRLIKYAVRLLCVVLCGVIVFITVKAVQTEKSPLGEKGVIDYPADLSELSPGAEPLLENNRLALYIDDGYCIRLSDKQSGKQWSSALSDEAQKFFNVSGDAAVSSCQIEFLSGDNTVTPYNSYIQSVNKQQARLYQTDNGIRLTFIFGERTSDDIIPQALTEERYKEIYSSLDDSQKDFIKRRYQLFSADTMTEADNPEEKFKIFPKLKSTPLYIISDVSGKVIIKKTKQLFEDIGYTREDYERDNELTGFDSPAKECVFKISYDMRLEDNDLIVNLPVSEIAFYDEYPMLSVTPLQFFTSSYDKSGEIIVPAGSGSVMSFDANNAKASFTSRFYGEDGTSEFEEIPALMLSGNNEALSMPFYCFTEGENSVMAIIESGAEAARLHIERDISSVYAYTSFEVVQSGYSYLTNKKKTLICGSDSIGTDISLRYRFISGGGYVKAAEEYKKYLIESDALKKNKLDKKPLILLESIGAIKSSSGKNISLTSISDAEAILKELSAVEDSRVSVKLNGMNKGGLYKQLPGDYTFNSDIADKKTYEAISRLAEKSGGKAYLQLNHLFYYNHTSFDGFSVKKITAKIIDKSWAVQGAFDPVEGTYASSKGRAWVLSPKAYKGIADGYSGSFKELGIGDFAGMLNSDYNSKSYFDRGDALKEVIKVLKLYEKSNAYIAAKSANAYALPYIDLIEELPTSGSSATIFDKGVPLCQLILHGSVEYTAKAANTCFDPQLALLNAIETGSGLHVALNKGIDFKLFKTENTPLFSTSYEENIEFALAAAEKLNAALNGLNDVEIVSHSKENNISATTYADGTVIYVNYNDTAAYINGIEVAARDYLRK